MPKAIHCVAVCHASYLHPIAKILFYFMRVMTGNVLDVELVES